MLGDFELGFWMMKRSFLKGLSNILYKQIK